jgi:endonuclease/exonuclease/phosphatase family metal-dependent hydrolase
VIRAEINTPDGIVHFFNTHLGLNTSDRKRQIQTMLENGPLNDLFANEPVIFCGDLNAGRRSPVYKKLSAVLNDVQKMGANHRFYPTFYSRYPLICLDHIFVSDHFEMLEVQTPRTDDTRRASDHLPLFVRLRLKSDTGGNNRFKQKSE